MAAQWDTSRYLSLFVGEATEHLDALGKELVRLEGGVTVEAIDSLFRHAHSVKGMAGSMGYESTTALAHSLEDLLDRVRSVPSRLDRGVADLVLQSVDALGGHVKAANAKASFPDSSVLVEQLRALTASMKEGAGPALGETAAPAPLLESAGATESELPPRWLVTLPRGTISSTCDRAREPADRPPRRALLPLRCRTEARGCRQKPRSERASHRLTTSRPWPGP